MEKEISIYEQVKGALATASHFIIASPLKLPPKVVAGARYVALLIGVLDAVDAEKPDRHPEGSKEEPPDE